MFKHKKNNELGITLIALVVTIIVLLILAGISIMMLTGNNGILTRAVEAKEMTEMSQLKELAEMVKYSMLMDKTTNGTGELTRSELVAGIATDSNFKGSTRSGYKVVTAGEKYDVKVGNDLSITVEKHVATVGKEIILTLTEEETESRAALLKVSATIDGVEEPTPTSLKEELDPGEIGNTEELKTMFLKAFNILYGKNFGVSYSSWSELEKAAGGGTQTPSSVFAMIKGMLPGAGYTSTEMYPFIIETGAYKPDITLICTNENKEEIDEITVVESGEFVVVTNEKYTVTATDDDGDYGEDSKTITKCGTETYTTTAVTADEGKNSKTVRDSDNNPVEVPAGFYYGTSNNVGKVSTGFVITDSVDSNGNSTGNEFVWIPVTTPVADAETDGTDNKAMAVKVGDNYRGLLYDFSETDSEVRDGCTSTNFTGHREPALVTNYDNDTSKPDGSEQTYLGQIGLNASSFGSALTSDYNAMIESVKKYGGFYVARYEMGVKKGTVVISKLGVNPATSFDETTKYWYGLYSKAKTYTTSSVQSSMIWGSQYDAMLNFALTGADKAKVVATTNGNHGGTQTKTGAYKGSDCINNIYDLEGNEWEWTLEAYLSHIRALRGGYFYIALSPRYRYDTITSGPYADEINIGSRATLYIR